MTKEEYLKKQREFAEDYIAGHDEYCDPLYELADDRFGEDTVFIEECKAAVDMMPYYKHIQPGWVIAMLLRPNGIHTCDYVVEKVTYSTIGGLTLKTHGGPNFSESDYYFGVVG